jgi:hypothetical protein
MVQSPPLIGYLLRWCFYLHGQEERSTPIPVAVNRPRNQGSLLPQLGHPSPDRPRIARIDADGALNPGWKIALALRSRKLMSQRANSAVHRFASTQVM